MSEPPLPAPPPPIRVPPADEFPAEVEMSLVDHLEELRRRVLRSLLAVVAAAGGCLLLVKPLVRLLEMPAVGMRFLQLAPGEFLFVSIKVAGYAGLTLALPYVLYEGLGFVLPGLTRRERRLVAPAVAGSAVLFAAGLTFAWWALVPAALRFLVSYGADVVEPIWSIERYLDFVLLLMVATGLAFQLPVLQLLLGCVRPDSLRCHVEGVALGGAGGGPGRRRAHALHRPRHDAAAHRLDHGPVPGGRGPGGPHRTVSACRQRRLRPGSEQEFTGPPAFSRLQGEAHRPAETGLVAGGGEPLAHLIGHPEVVKQLDQLLQLGLIALGVERKRLLLQVGPHHLQIETATPLHQLEVVGSMPALTQQLQHFIELEGGEAAAGAGLSNRIRQGHGGETGKLHNSMLRRRRKPAPGKTWRPGQRP